MKLTEEDYTVLAKCGFGEYGIDFSFVPDKLVYDILATCRKHLEQKTVIIHEWIPITEKLPPLIKDILFCCYLEDSDDCTSVGFGWYAGNKTEGDAIAIETYDGWYPCTHWMPLPETPKVP